MAQKERAIILVKAWPQPSQRYGETVCCAGMTPDGNWRRLFPIRFRHLSGKAQFARWDIVEYEPHTPRDDNRSESRRVEESSLAVVGSMAPAEREGFFDNAIRGSLSEAAARGESLTLLRPETLEFRWRAKGRKEMDAEVAKARKATVQGSLFDAELSRLETCPYTMRVGFTSGGVRHFMTCGDWETAATFWKWRKSYGELGALQRLKAIYEDTYMKAGVALALGTVKKRPRQWLLLGVIRLNETVQPRLI